jgi:hypothetical protein
MRGRHTWRPGSKVAIGRVIFFVGALAIAGTIAVLQDTDEGGCVPAEFPNKWLESQEAAGGHTIARHVGKDDAWLTERLARDPRIPAASSFSTLADARLAIRAALSSHRARINNWANTTARNKRRAWDYDGSFFVGQVAERGDADGVPDRSTDLKVVFKADGKGGCILLTAYPIAE